jgi:putative CocE/NonD family hydrolase
VLNLTVEHDIPATMRDGVVLRADIYRPFGDGPWPVLLVRLPYGKNLPGLLSVIDPMFFARSGFIVIMQDTRGRFASEGHFEPLMFEEDDGYDTVRWAASIEGSNGSVGMYGMSYFGNTQWMAAVAAAPELKAIAPAFTWSEPEDGLFSRGGASEYGLGLPWSLTQGIDTVLRRHADDPTAQGQSLMALIGDIDNLSPNGYKQLPTARHPAIARHDVQELGYGRGPHESSRNQRCRVANRHADVDVPSLNIGGWYDVFTQGTLDNFVAMTRKGLASNLIMGPWTHLNQSGFVGEVNFGMAASAQLTGYRGTLNQIQAQWFREHLLTEETREKAGEAAGQPLPPVLLFVTGANEWRAEEAWPLARAVDTELYLHEGGHLSFDPPTIAASADAYQFDPMNPAPTVGGSTLMTEGFVAGPVDQRDVEARADVLVYTTESLAEDCEVTGRVRAKIYVASDAESTDWVVRICDVDEVGVSRNVADGILRSNQVPNEYGEREVDMWSISHVFRAGHRIRVHVTSSSFPRWDRNFGSDSHTSHTSSLRPANNSLAHDKEHRSHLILPVVTARKPLGHKF